MLIDLPFVNRTGWAWNNVNGMDTEANLFAPRTWLSVRDYGIVPGKDCTAKINELMVKYSANGFITIFWPPGNYTAVGPINFPRFNVVWQGCGGSAAGAGASVLTLTGNGSSPLITMNDCFGCEIRDMQFVTSNASYTGTVLRITNTGVTDPQKNALRHVSFYDAEHSCGFVALDESIETVLEGCNFIGGSFAISGMNSGGYSNVVSILNCQFHDSENVPIQNMGECWHIENNTFEPLSDNTAGAILTTTNTRPIGCSIIGNWFGDITDDDGTWITLWGTGHVITGNKISGDGVHNTLGISLNAVVGCEITGNDFDHLTTGISFDTTGCDRITTEPNNWNTVTNKRANTNNLAGFDQAATGNSLGTSWEWIQNGKVREWGFATVTTGSGKTITYPKALTADPESINFTLVNPSGTGNTVYGSSIGSTTMVLNVAGTAGDNTVYWEVAGTVT